MPKKTEPKDTQSTQPEQVQQIRISDIYPFKNHPFKVVDDALMQETVDSIMQFGVLNPTIIRPEAVMKWSPDTGACTQAALPGKTRSQLSSAILQMMRR